MGHGVIQERLPESSASRLLFFPREDPNAFGIEVRVPTVGSMDSLTECFRQYLGRFESSNSTLLESSVPLYEPWPYTAGIPRPHAVFKLIDENDDTVTYPQSKLVHIAGMVKHLAIETMKTNSPRDLRGRTPDEWVDSYVAGHETKENKDRGAPHAQLSYIPLQSIGNPNTDPGVRRVMVVAPVGDDAWLEHLVARLDGALLEPLPATKLPAGTRLERIDDHRRDGVRDAYLRASTTWASVTPVILPGHDDRKPEKTRSLLLKALQHSGIEQPCTFEWSAFSHFRKMLTAHKYRKDPNDPTKKMLINYIRPDHLLDQTAVHVLLTFANGLAIPGPVTLGAGRHYGFGLMAAIK
jgi:CRISPR-associated protein Csb2